jgi:hypothetical protein
VSSTLRNLGGSSNLIQSCLPVADQASCCTVGPTVDARGAVNPRRWRSAIAIVAALSLFAAALGCWSLQSRLAAAAMLRPPASSQGTPGVGMDIGQVHFGHSSSPTSRKPFKSAGMKRDRPPTWARLTPQSVWAASPVLWSLRPTILAALGFQPGDAHFGASVAAALCVRDILTQLCVDRR